MIDFKSDRITVAKTARDEIGSYIAAGISRNIFISCFGKYSQKGAIVHLLV